MKYGRAPIWKNRYLDGRFKAVPSIDPSAFKLEVSD